MIEVKHEETSYFSITIVRKFTRYSRSSVQWRTISVARLAPSGPHRPITMRLASRTHIFLYSVTTLLQVLYPNDRKRALLRDLKNLFYPIYLHTISACAYTQNNPLQICDISCNDFLKHESQAFITSSKDYRLRRDAGSNIFCVTELYIFVCRNTYCLTGHSFTIHTVRQRIDLRRATAGFLRKSGRIPQTCLICSKSNLTN